MHSPEFQNSNHQPGQNNPSKIAEENKEKAAAAEMEKEKGGVSQMFNSAYRNSPQGQIAAQFKAVQQNALQTRKQEEEKIPQMKPAQMMEEKKEGEKLQMKPNDKKKK